MTFTNGLMRCALALVLAHSVAGCGGSSPPPEPEPEPTAGAEEEPEPPPPPPPARLRIIHAAFDPSAASVSTAFDGEEPLIADLSYLRASPYVELAAGEHAVSLVGADGAELLGWTSPAVSDDSYTTVVLASGEELPVLFVAATDVTTPPAATVAALRVFHGVVGMPSVDVCLAGESARRDGIQIFSGVGAASFAGTEDARYAEIPASGLETTLQLRNAHATPCHGRILGVARVTPIAGNRYTLVAIGRTSGGPRIDRELLVCADPPATDTSCAVVPITSR